MANHLFQTICTMATMKVPDATVTLRFSTLEAESLDVVYRVTLNVPGQLVEICPEGADPPSRVVLREEADGKISADIIVHLAPVTLAEMKEEILANPDIYVDDVIDAMLGGKALVLLGKV